MARFYGATAQQNLIAKDGNATNYVTWIEIMNTSARLAYMAFSRIIRWNLDTDGCCTMRTKLHANFLEMGGDKSA